MSGNLTTLIILVTLLHVAAFAVMIMIRLRRDEARGPAGGATAAVLPCAVCSAPATHLGYDGLDPQERHDPHTGRPYSTNDAHYQPLCAAH